MKVFLVFLLGFGVARSLNLGHPALPFDGNGEYAASYEDYKPRDYKFEYGVSDPHTGDHKSHWEVRENGVVRGEYSLLEPDGTTRVVQYTADDHGFRAVVKKIGHAVHPPQHHLDSHETPIIVPDIIHEEQPYYKTYDGNAENYINIIDDSHLSSLLQNNHQVLDNPIPNAHIQESVPLPHHAPESVSEHAYYPSFDIGSVAQNQDTYDHEILSKINENHIPIHQETLHVAEPFPNQEPTQEIKSVIQPVYYNYAPPQPHESISQVNQPSVHHAPIYIQEPKHIQEHVNSVYNPTETQSTIGLKVIHPHGESSSSFIGTTGNLEDDSVYTRHDKAVVVPGGQDYQGWNAYDRPIPYQYLQKREITSKHEKSV